MDSVNLNLDQIIVQFDKELTIDQLNAHLQHWIGLNRPSSLVVRLFFPQCVWRFPQRVAGRLNGP